jgi:hypothetical protein
MERLKAFNPCALIEFFIGPMEDYYKRRLLNHAHNRHSEHLILFDRLTRRTENINVNDIEKLDDNLYKVPSSLNNGII